MVFFGNFVPSRLVNTYIHTYSPREIAQLDYISQFTTDIRYIKGLDNPVAHALSRSSINAIYWPNGIDLKKMADKREETVAQSTSKSLKLERVPLANNDGFILSDVSKGRPRLLVPLACDAQSSSACIV